MSRRDVERFKTQYPSLDQSTINDVLQNYSNDEKKTSEALREMADQIQRDLDGKVEELQGMFSNLPRDIIIEELQAVGGSVDGAIAPLFSRDQEIQQDKKKKLEEQRRKQREEEEVRRRKEEEKKQAGNLMEIFKNIPQQKVQAILDENDGDIEETTAQLIKMVAKQEQEEARASAKAKAAEEEKRRKHEQDIRLREIKFQALKNKLEDLSNDQITASLDANGWDIKKALEDLTVISIAKKREEIKDLFNSIDNETIELALEANNHDKIKAVRALTMEREKRRAEEIAANVQDAAEGAAEDKKDRKKRHRKSKPRKSSRSSKDTEDTSISPSTSPTNNTIIISKVKQNALEKSVILGQLIEKEIAANQQDYIKEDEKKRVDERTAAQAIFRGKLEHIIDQQARAESVPGMVAPPLVKEIDAMMGKNRPDVDVPSASIQEKEMPEVKAQSQLSDDVKPLVTINVNQTLVDIGNPIIVDWEITSGVSSAWDWIGLYAVDKPNKQYVTYQWSGKQLMKGSLTFSAPAVYGEYEFRYFPNGYFDHATMSSKFKVGPQIELSGTLDKEAGKINARWVQKSGNLYSKSWIGLYDKKETNNGNYVAWQYAGKPNTDIVFDAPFKPREYELRFFTNSYVDVSRSQPIRIEGDDKLSAEYVDGFMVVKYNLVSIDPYAECGWIGVFKTDQANNRQWRKTKMLTERVGEYKFVSCKTGGEYEIRLFANRNYDVILKSNKFIVPDSH